MSARERLQGLQAALEERGVRDAKFYFHDVTETPISHVVEDVVAALAAFNEQRVHPLSALGDSPES